jgi:dihydroflavonol-4-reductase
MTQTAFVTGGVGLLGSNLVRLLAGHGYKVRALVLPSEMDKVPIQFSGIPVDIVPGDMRAVAGFAHALSGVDIVFHTAAYYRDYLKGGRHWEALYSTNVAGTRSLLETAYCAGIRRFVHASSIAVLEGRRSTPINETMLRDERRAEPYYRSKILADREVLAFLDQHADMWAAMVLPGWMHGPGDAAPTPAGQSVLDFLKGNIPGILPGAFSIVDVRDVANAMFLAALKGRCGERYLAAGRAVTSAEYLALLAAIAETKIPQWRIPRAALYAIAAASEGWARLTHKPVSLSLAAMRLLDQRLDQLQFDHTKSQTELGLEFRPIESALRDEIAWFRAHGYLPKLSAGPGREELLAQNLAQFFALAREIFHGALRLPQSSLQSLQEFGQRLPAPAHRVLLIDHRQRRARQGRQQADLPLAGHQQHAARGQGSGRGIPNPVCRICLFFARFSCLHSRSLR